MTSIIGKQDLPPSGGYPNIPYKRVPPKTYFGGWTMIAGYLGITAASLYIYGLTYKSIREEEIERRSARLAMFPMLLAERDREFLKQLRRNRDEETKLMKNVEGWETGTLYGEPIYKTLPKDEFIVPSFHEYYLHTDNYWYRFRAHMKMWT